MPVYTDQIGKAVTIREIPQRIVSLVPSQTELLYHLGLEEEVAGITKFCVHPQHWFRTKKRVGGTKNVHIETIKQLQPDLVLASKEENVREQIEALEKDYPVWTSDVRNLPQALELITAVGAITNRQEAAQQLATSIQTKFAEWQRLLTRTAATPLRTVYLIWKDPYMSVGGDTFIHDMLQQAGFHNLFAHQTRYPVTTIEEIQSLNCPLLLLSSEPYPFKEKHIAELQQQLPHTKILLVDGELFSWYGSRLLQTPAYFRQLHQELRGKEGKEGKEEF